MKKNVKSKIPIFKSNEEEAHFWDAHSVTDFEDETLVVRLQKTINVSTPARIWFSEKLHQTV